MTHDPLFESFDLNELSLDNRIGLAPMTRTSATEEGYPTKKMARYYASFARGGFPFLISEGICTDTAHSQGYPNQPGLATDAQADAWAEVVNEVHKEEGVFFAQLMHAGAQAQGNRYVDRTVAPSTYQPPGEMAEVYGGSGAYQTAVALDDSGLSEVKTGFVEAAEHAAQAGFDGVEVHAANGYLLHEFIDPLVNERNDKYGGSPKARARFPAEITAAIQETTPEEFVVGVRTSQTAVTDEERTWPDEEDTAKAVFESFTSAGADYIHVTEPEVTEPAFGENGRTLTELADRYSVCVYPDATSGTA